MAWIPLIVMCVWWLSAALVIFVFYYKFTTSKISTVIKHTYENLPTVYYKCNGFTANFAYLFSLSYGRRNKRFFFPNATFIIDIFDSDNHVLATLRLKPQILIDNHRRYLKRPSGSKIKELDVILKSKNPLTKGSRVLLNHDVHGGTIIVYSLYVLSLDNNELYGTKIGKSIECLEKGFNDKSQSFSYAHFGKSPHYLRPSTNLHFLETVMFLFMGVSTSFLFCSSALECKEERMLLVCRYYRGLSHALQVCLFSSLVSLGVTWTVLLVYWFILLPLNAKRNNMGCIWLLLKLIPFIACAYCLILDVTTLILLKTIRSPVLMGQQYRYWVLAAGLAIIIHLLVMLILYMLLYLFQYYDEPALDQFDLEADQKYDGQPKETSGSGSSKLNDKKASFSTVNLMISSQLQEKPGQASAKSQSKSKSTSRAESISKLIDDNFSPKKDDSSSKTARTNKKNRANRK